MRKPVPRLFLAFFALTISASIAVPEDLHFDVARHGLRAMSIASDLSSEYASLLERLLELEYESPSEKRDAAIARILSYFDSALKRPRERVQFSLVAAACLPDPALVTRYSGGKVALKDGDGYTPLMAAAQYNPKAEVVRELASFYELDAMDSKQRTALALACEHSYSPAVVEALLDAGADSQHSVKSAYPYDAALRNARLKGELALLERLAPFKGLLFAVAFKDAEAVSAALKAGADPNVKDSEGFTPLAIAAKRDAPRDMLAALVRGGARLDTRMGNGMQALHVAAIHSKSIDTVASLVALGADVAAVDSSGRVPRYYAEKNPLLDQRRYSALLPWSDKDLAAAASVSAKAAAEKERKRAAAVSALASNTMFLRTASMGGWPAASFEGTVQARLDGGALWFSFSFPPSDVVSKDWSGSVTYNNLSGPFHDRLSYVLRVAYPDCRVDLRSLKWAATQDSSVPGAKDLVLVFDDFPWGGQLAWTLRAELTSYRDAKTGTWHRMTSRSGYLYETKGDIEAVRSTFKADAAAIAFSVYPSAARAMADAINYLISEP
ncbi:MAG: ankyrin repeat domain-containing protein [Spirochaetes bacterium]|nr:ankyrin repeat domain-containing protein [Spirochaetota bacterium]MBU1079999.1 ankyrin repeat domain-containing protein [Spirochaetota bacterium]